MAIEDNAIQEFIASIKPQEYGTVNRSSAVVSHVDDEGVVWVNVAGSVIETPTASISSEVSAGDDVTVEWRNNKLYIVGNTSNPSAGSIRVTAVEQAAQVASQAAANAVADADIARQAAESAEASAESAQESATNASEYASRALGNLSTVQSVTETLNWITAHGTMTLTADTALDPTHVYFVVDANGDYVVGNTHYSVVTEPSIDDISTYYELSIDESLNNYVGTHLAVTSEGLWLLPDAGGNKVLIATGQGSTYTSAGTYIIGKDNGSDVTLATFLASGAQVGRDDEPHLLLKSDSIVSYYDNNILLGLYLSKEESVEEEIVEDNNNEASLTWGVTLRSSKKEELPNTGILKFSITYKQGSGTIEFPQTKSYEFAFDITDMAYNTSFDVVDMNLYAGNDDSVLIGNFRLNLSKGRDVWTGTIDYSLTYYIGIDLSIVSLYDISYSYPLKVVNEASYRFGAHLNERWRGLYSFIAGGADNQSRGDSSFVSGRGNIAEYDQQVVIGKYNKSANAAFVIGNGTDDNNRSNALAVDWDGSVYLNSGKRIHLNYDLWDSFDHTGIYAANWAQGGYGETNNLYLQADGYIAMYVGSDTEAPTGKLYVYNDAVSVQTRLSVADRIYTTSYIQTGGYIQAGGNVYVPNGGGLAGRNSGNTAWYGLCGVGSDNSSLFGYASYNNTDSSNTTSYFEGYNVNVRAKNSISIGGYQYHTVNNQTLSWASGTAGAGIYLSRCGRVATLTISNPTKLAVGNNVVATIPVGYRPAYVSLTLMLVGPVGSIASGGTNLSLRASINPNGNIEIYNYRSTAINGNTNQYGTITYVIGG